MNSKKIIFILFILVAFIQLYLPAKVIYDQENLLNTGKEYKFRVAPIDPNDPFRGKYITVYFEENTIEVENTDDWKINETVYINLTSDQNGFAKINGFSKVKPNQANYIKVKVQHAVTTEKKNLILKYPFERFYMEESKAPRAEKMYNELSRDTSQIAFALVNVKNGEGIIKDVLINGIPIRELARKDGRDKE